VSDIEADDQQRAFDEQQRSGVGSTDSPKLLGLSKYGTALTVYERIVGGAPPHQPSLPAWLGLKMQRTVAELYTEATGIRVRADNGHHRHPTLPFIVTHLDYRAWGNRQHLVEAKTRA
jgi:predicted phage-related endonuclease